MSKLARIKMTRALGGDPIVPALATTAGRAAIGFAGKLAKGVASLFTRKTALPVAATVALPAAAGKAGQLLRAATAPRVSVPLAAGGLGAWGVSKLVGGEEKKRRRRKGLTACEIRGYYKVLRLVKKAGMRPRIYRKRG